MIYLHIEQYSKESNEATVRCRWILGERAFLSNGSQGFVDPTSQNSAEASFLHKKFVSAFEYRSFLNAGGSKFSNVENDAKFRTFWPRVKMRGEASEISIPIVEALSTIEPPEHLIAIHCAAAEHVGLIKRKKVHG